MSDEDNMASNSAVKVPSQQSTKAYADTKLAKATNVTAINDTGIADGEIAVFNLTNKKFCGNVTLAVSPSLVAMLSKT